MAKLVLHFGWTWVGTIAADDDYGKYGIKDFKEQVEEAGVCISFSETLPKVTSRSITSCLSFLDMYEGLCPFVTIIRCTPQRTSSALFKL